MPGERFVVRAFDGQAYAETVVLVTLPGTCHRHGSP